MPQMTTAEAIVASPIAHGIDTMYALPGVARANLLSSKLRRVLVNRSTDQCPLVPQQQRESGHRGRSEMGQSLPSRLWFACSERGRLP